MNVLIYRIGSIGDTAVALPSLKLAARVFPDANRILLTNFPGKGEAPVKSIIENMNLAHDYIDYPIATRDISKLFKLRSQIAALRAKTLIYLTPRNDLTSVLRDIAFFKASGISRIVGAPLSANLRNCRLDPKTGLWEQEGARLARCLASIGDARLSETKSWSLELTGAEKSAASEALLGWRGSAKFLALAVGAKISTKDWAGDNWLAAISQLARIYPDWGLAFVGGAGVERERAEKLGSQWSGPTINLCGLLTPRVSAAVMERAKLFLGHDGGPMHLAAAVGVPVVAIFSARNRKGVWFPHQPDAEILYRDVPCSGCDLEECIVERKKCILSIRPEDVVAACRRKLDTPVSMNLEG